MQKILCLSGKKQAGKNTAANFIYGLIMSRTAVTEADGSARPIIDSFRVTETGKLLVKFPDLEEPYLYDPDKESAANEFMNRFVRIYSFADLLKRSVCMDILGLSYLQCYGSDEDKDTPTSLRWENMPGIITIKPPKNKTEASMVPTVKEYYDKCLLTLGYHKPGFMTVREVMQYVGTEIFRKMMPEVWANATIRRIQQDGSMFAIVSDGRFPNEVLAVKNAGGKNIRLTRAPLEDTHDSETVLDKDKFDWSNFDSVIDNQDMNVWQQCDAVQTQLTEWGWL